MQTVPKLSPESTMFVLGADDPEMRRIKEVLTEQGLPFTMAKVGGEEVHPGNAYSAEMDDYMHDPALTNLVMIETDVDGVVPSIRIDHHRDTDPGYHLGAEGSWLASSLGQLHFLLGLEPSEYDLLIAAMDHHFAGAIRGEVPGVDPNKVLDLKIAEIASGNNTSKAYVKRVIEKHKNALSSIMENRDPSETSVKTIAGFQVIDYTDTHLGAGYNTEVLGAETAAILLGIPCLMKLKDTPEGSDKISIDGAPAKLIEYFMHSYSGFLRLSDVYGVPARGYAGGYLES